ncbi:hypothetical protein B1813_12500 [Saccharomonospora piscinae]|uniref:Uncharacterized protein n=1 Tax=Saccharomonospora piscinae TaxID=687388 RepID=A0A1V9A763_SACPI|nr:hypothetical protein [Saccharomonospora piscinae]OQO92933.1 hypothetical protein B1813_12500 [Saccharomonospora piscinae]
MTGDDELGGVRGDDRTPDDLLLDRALRELHRDARDAPAALDEVRVRVLTAARAERERATTATGPARGRAAQRWLRQRWLPTLTAAAAAVAAVAVPLAVTSGGSGVANPAAESSRLNGVTRADAREVLHRAAKAADGTAAPAFEDRRFRIVQRDFVSGLISNGADELVRGQWRRTEIDTETAEPGRWQVSRQQENPVPLGAEHVPGPHSAPAVDDHLCSGSDTDRCLDESIDPARYAGLADERAVLENLASTSEPLPSGLAWPSDVPEARATSTTRTPESHGPVESSPDAVPDPLSTAVSVLRTGVISGDLRAAVYRELAGLPGLRVTEREVTMDGRTGVAVGLDDGHTLREVVVDPATGDFVGARVIATTETGLPGVEPGTLLSATSVSVTAAPPQRSGP